MTTAAPEIEQIHVPETAEPGDHERLSHYVPKHALTQAMIEGTPCIALCGKTWVPTRDGLKFPVCPECKQIWDEIPNPDEPVGD